MVRKGIYIVTSFEESDENIPFGDVCGISSRLKKVILTEAPITESLLKKRVANSYGIMRIGSIVDALLDEGIALLSGDEEITAVDECGERTFHKKGEEDVFRPTPDEPEKTRYSYQIPPSEGALVLEYIALDGKSWTKKALSESFKVELGYKKKGSQVEKLFLKSLQLAMESGKLTRLGNGRIKTNQTEEDINADQP